MRVALFESEVTTMLLFLTGLWVLLSIVFGVIIGRAIRRADLAERSWRTPDDAVRSARSRSRTTSGTGRP